MGVSDRERAASLRRSARDRSGPWPTVQMRIRRNGSSIAQVALVGPRSLGLEDVLMPDDEPTLLALAAIATGTSRARLYVRNSTDVDEEQRSVVCVRGAPGAVPVTGQVSTVADILFAGTRTAVLTLAKASRDAGCDEEARRWKALGRRLLAAGREANRGHSVRTLSGGLPTLGHRH